MAGHDSECMAEARGRSYSKRRGSGIVARLRSRSASVSRANRRKEPRAHTDEVDPTPKNAERTSTQVEDLLERHQLALKMDVIELVEARDKEVKFWKHKALKLRKRMSALERKLSKKGKSLDDADLLLDETVSTACEGSASEKHLEKKVAALEEQLRARDEQVDALRHIVETQERTNQERVRLLESQLGRLVGMTKVDANAREEALASSASTVSTQMMTSDQDLYSSSGSACAESSSHDHEVAALEQLLARVLAEKDRLTYQNEGLRSVVAENNGTATSTNGDAGILYQLSCRDCSVPHYIGSATKELKQEVHDHFSSVWELLQKSKGGGISGAEASASNDFMSCPLAEHLADHCRGMRSEIEVRLWCKKNVKVEKIDANSRSESRSEF